MEKKAYTWQGIVLLHSRPTRPCLSSRCVVLSMMVYSLTDYYEITSLLQYTTTPSFSH